MTSVQSSIRAEVSCREIPAPSGAEVFSTYAIASAKGLIPEMENATRQTLDHPMTFEILGEGLRLFEGWALRDLASFRKHYRDNLMSCLKSCLEPENSQFNIWTPCVSYIYNSSAYNRKGSHISSGLYSLSNLAMSNTNISLPSWLAELYQKHLDESREGFSKSLLNPRSIHGVYLSALQTHINSQSCVSCTKVHTEKGETFCENLEDRLTWALNEVCPSYMFRRCCGS